MQYHLDSESARYNTSVVKFHKWDCGTLAFEFPCGFDEDQLVFQEEACFDGNHVFLLYPKNDDENLVKFCLAISLSRDEMEKVNDIEFMTNGVFATILFNTENTTPIVKNCVDGTIKFHL